MKIAIIGYGKMGHMVEKAALERGHTVVCIIDNDDLRAFESPGFRSADVAIEFSTPGSAVDNILRSFAAGVPVVCGTTGWLAAMPDIKAICAKGEGTLLYGSNFSVGVNIFMGLNKWLARVMDKFPGYTPSLTEIHHIHKLDHPSGTAITLAEGIVANAGCVSSWAEPEEGEALQAGVLPVNHIREGEVPGTHIITWDSSVDKITVSHEAKSREGFAVGAVLGAEWLLGKTGYHDVAEIFADIL